MPPAGDGTRSRRAARSSRRRTAETAAVIRAAAELDLPLWYAERARSRTGACPPERARPVLDTRRLTGVVEHAAGDLIVVVRAGTPLADLSKLAAPASSSRSTRRSRRDRRRDRCRRTPAGRGGWLYGTVRDLLIGVTFVRADGVVAKAGGKVVKNVAGYDLGKLFTGSTARSD